MLDYSEVTVHKYIIFENEPWEVIDSHVFRKQQRKPVNATKLRNLITGRVTEVSFHVNDNVEEAEIEKQEVKYLYTNRGEYWFCDAKDPSKRFTLSADFVGDAGKWMKANSVITAKLFNDKIFGVELPIKVELKVTEASDAVRGDTARSAGKYVKVETGAELLVPMFINQGEVIRINTEKGEYVERVNN